MITDISANHHLGSLLSFFLVDGVGLVGFALLILHALRCRAREDRASRVADASADINPRLTPGPAVLFGKVEYARAATSAVRVDIDQDGTEWESSGQWSHKWTEKNRRVHVEPFYIRVSRDKRIRVEPTRDVFLVDDMDGLIRVDLMKRVKFAELTPDEEIYASGELVRAQDPEIIGETSGYRSAPETLVLRPRPGESMLLSSEPLGDRYRARVRFYTAACRGLIIAMLAFHVAFVGFHLRTFFGETITTTITNLEHYTTKDDDDDDIHHYRVWVETPRGVSLSDHVHGEVFRNLKVGDEVPFRWVPWGFSTAATIGADVTVHFMGFSVVPILAIVYLVYRYTEKNSKPWYDREVNDSGSGRLEETLDAERTASTAQS